MANNPRNDEFPTIRLDEEDRRSYQQKKTTTPTSAPPASLSTNSESESRGGNGLWIGLVAILAIGGCAGTGYLYTKLQQQLETSQLAEQRIAQLENKLSATGEEIGESTVALQVKVTELSNKSNELWEQMDKLWASAWRRNQKEIADLSDRVTSEKQKLQASISQVDKSASAHQTQLSAISSNLDTLKDEMLALSVQMEQVSSDKGQQAQALKNTNDKLAVLEQRNNALSSRISKLEADIKDMATRIISNSPASTTPSGTP